LNRQSNFTMADVPVIDWDEAMEQCGDDEEFCRELLSDLRGEVDQQVIRIDEMLTQVRILDFTLDPFQDLARYPLPVWFDSYEHSSRER